MTQLGVVAEHLSGSIAVLQGADEAGLLEQCKSQICDNIALYAQKYDEEFATHLPVLVTDVWNLLVSCGKQLKYDLVSVTVNSGLEVHVLPSHR